MTFLYAVVQDSEKNKQKEGKKEEPHKAPTITKEELRRDAERHEANRAQEKQRLEHIEKDKQMAEATAQFDKEIEEKQKNYG